MAPQAAARCGRPTAALCESCAASAGCTSTARLRAPGICTPPVAARLAARLHMGCALVRMQLRRSTVVGAGGESVVDNYRTSYGMFIRWGQGEGKLAPRVAPQPGALAGARGPGMPAGPRAVRSCLCRAAAQLLLQTNLRRSGAPNLKPALCKC